MFIKLTWIDFMKKTKNIKLFDFGYISKFFILFIIFILLVAFSRKSIIYERIIPSKGYYEKEKTTELQTDIKVGSAVPTGFNWSVEKVDEHLTKISLPPDPRMSTSEELFEAMNSYRSAHSVSILQKNDTICLIAAKRVEEQVANGGLDGHAGFEKYAQGQGEFSVMGEVLFGGVQPQYGVHIVEFGWDRSLTGHKEAIQEPSWQYGCGGVSGYYAVFIFGTK